MAGSTLATSLRPLLDMVWRSTDCAGLRTDRDLPDQNRKRHGPGQGWPLGLIFVSTRFGSNWFTGPGTRLTCATI